jgi:dihydroorotase
VALQTLTIRRPDDWHVHLRDGEMTKLVAPFTARQFARAIVMPNLIPPITTLGAAADYRQRVRDATGPGFQPLMTFYLTDEAEPDLVEHGFNDDVWIAAKLYPANATTNSAFGVTDVRNIYPVLERMQRLGMVLCIHGEVTDPEVDVFDREAVFIERTLGSLIRDFPELKVVLEHITTAEAADFVEAGGPNLAATVTPQHLMFNRNAMFERGLRPHAYCLPVAKREKHRQAVRRAATSGSPKFFLGSDSAPHPRHAKESSCGCAGIFNAPVAMEAYATVFDEEGALDKLEAFASVNGPSFYGLPLNDSTITLERKPMQVADALGLGDIELVPFLAGTELPWSFAD